MGDVCDPDTDGDGIFDPVDGSYDPPTGIFTDESRTVSERFSDYRLGGVSFGSVESAVGLTLHIIDAADPSEGLQIDFVEGDPADEAELVACNADTYRARLTLGDSVVLTCGSVQIRAVTDQVELVSSTTPDIKILIPDSVTAKVDELGPDQFEVVNDPASPDDLIMTLGDTTVIVPAASAATVTETIDGQFAIENSEDSLQPLMAEINGQTITIEPGAPPTLPVSIDIKPGSDDNTVNLGSKGSIPVAILSTATFDAASVNAALVTLSSAPVKLKGKGTAQTSMEDVNGDGLLDQIVHVSTEALELNETATEAVLDGFTFGETAIRGVDVIRVVP